MRALGIRLRRVLLGDVDRDGRPCPPSEGCLARHPARGPPTSRHTVVLCRLGKVPGVARGDHERHQQWCCAATGHT